MDESYADPFFFFFFGRGDVDEKGFFFNLIFNHVVVSSCLSRFLVGSAQRIDC